MPDARLLLLGMVLLIGVGFVATVLVLASRRTTIQRVSPNSPGHRLAVLAHQRSDYRMLVGVPPSKPVFWAVVSRVTDDIATVEGHGNIPLEQVNAFVVSYPSGQMIDYELAGLLPPTGMTGYARTQDGWTLSTVTSTFYSAREFCEWYGLGEKEWLGAGESACDPNNYGGLPMLWAYHCEAEDGEEFIAGNVLE